MSDAGPGPLYLGLISGTSADGIDAALVRFEPTLQLVAARTFAYPADLRGDVLRLSQSRQSLTLDELGMLDRRVGRAFAEAARRLLEDADCPPNALAAIGSHGQTLRHQPLGPDPYTLQIGDPTQIAESLGRPVVADFRRRDMAAGGQGAPLVPAFHAAWLQSGDEARAVLNIGGIANLSLLPAGGTPLGFDTGPGNGLMDAWCLLHTGAPFDAGGQLAAAGRVDNALLANLLSDAYFHRPAPKSTGRDYFHLEWLQAHLGATPRSVADVQATLLELTAHSIAAALDGSQPETTRLLVCGGGVHNPRLLERLAQLLPQAAVESTAAQGVDPDFLEAMAFAWLARETLAGRPGNRPEVTGARGARVLGAIYPA